MTELPKLPESHYRWLGLPMYVEGDVRAYGAECYRKALEDAALKCEEHCLPVEGTIYSNTARACAAAIRGMP